LRDGLANAGGDIRENGGRCSIRKEKRIDHERGDNRRHAMNRSEKCVFRRKCRASETGRVAVRGHELAIDDDLSGHAQPFRRPPQQGMAD
jgi:hypothetical protein